MWSRGAEGSTWEMATVKPGKGGKAHHGKKQTQFLAKEKRIGTIRALKP